MSFKTFKKDIYPENVKSYTENGLQKLAVARTIPKVKRYLSAKKYSSNYQNIFYCEISLTAFAYASSMLKFFLHVILENKKTID